MVSTTRASTIHTKSYWSILKRFITTKTSLIPPLLINDRFKTKANLFNKFFAKQCTLLKNDSVIPTSQRFLARSRLHPFKFSLDEIPKIIRSPDVNKAHGHDDISVAMTKKL